MWGSRTEDREIVALGDFDDNVFIDAFGGEVFGQLLAEKAGMGADDTVFTGVVARGTLEDVHTDVLFGCFLRTIANGTIGYIDQNLSEAPLVGEELALAHADN